MCSELTIFSTYWQAWHFFLYVIFRWSQLRISLLPHLILFEPLSECMLMGVIASWAAEYIFGISSMGFFLMHVLVWFLFDYALLTCVEVGSDSLNTCSNIQSLITKNSTNNLPLPSHIYTHTQNKIRVFFLVFKVLLGFYLPFVLENYF